MKNKQVKRATKRIKRIERKLIALDFLFGASPVSWDLSLEDAMRIQKDIPVLSLPNVSL